MCATPQTSVGGAEKCTLCVKGFFYDKDRKGCVACPEGSTCDGYGQLPKNEAGCKLLGPVQFSSVQFTTRQKKPESNPHITLHCPLSLSKKQKASDFHVSHGHQRLKKQTNKQTNKQPFLSSSFIF